MSLFTSLSLYFKQATSEQQGSGIIFLTRLHLSIYLYFSVFLSLPYLFQYQGKLFLRTSYGSGWSNQDRFSLSRFTTLLLTKSLLNLNRYKMSCTKFFGLLVATLIMVTNSAQKTDTSVFPMVNILLIFILSVNHVWISRLHHTCTLCEVDLHHLPTHLLRL